MFGFQYMIEGSRTFNVDTLKPIATNPFPQAEAFEAVIFKLLSDIDQDTAVGRRVLRSLWIGNEVGFVPGTTLLAKPITKTPGDALGKGFKDGKFTGTGKGAPAVVFVDPAMLAAAQGPAAQKDAMLLHEVFHAIRMASGLLQRMPLMKYDDLEEFYAVTITNMYVSSKYPGKPLRGDHRMTFLHKIGYPDKLRGLMSGPGLEENMLYYFAMGHREELVKLIKEMETLCLNLKDAPCKFNPIRVAYNGYDPDVEEKDRPQDRRRKRGYGPFVDSPVSPWSKVPELTEKQQEMFRGSILDRYNGL
jgi:hypothetical protein